jgi:predicted amidohydrolase YtcJ
MTQIFYNGNIYTGSGNFAEAFAVEDGHFTFVGSNRDALALTGEKMDLQEKFVCAGFNDSHMHLLNLGNALCIAPLAQHTGSLADMLRSFKIRSTDAEIVNAASLRLQLSLFII